MVASHTEQKISTNYLLALTKLAEDIMVATGKLINISHQYSLAVTPESIIQIYLDWLGFIITKKINGDKTHLFQLVSTTIQDQIKQGEKLFETVQSTSEQETIQINMLVETNGEIIIPVLKLNQFISKIVTQMYNPQIKTHLHEHPNAATILEEQYEIFDQAFQTTVLEINAFNIENPLIFLLEHFSIMVGWITGFFMKATNKSQDAFVGKNFACLKKSFHDLAAVPNKIH